MRTRKIVCLLVLVAFALFEWSCASSNSGRGPTKTVKTDIAKVDRTNVKLKIINVVTKEGKDIAFLEQTPAHFNAEGGAVVGTALQQFAFKKDDVEISYKGKGQKRKVVQVKTSDGQTYKVLTALDQGEEIVVNAYAPISIPIEDIQQVWIKKSDSTGIVVGVLLTAAVVVALYLTLKSVRDGIAESAAGFDSCPFVYSWDGDKYVLDAEPYGAAISEGLKRTDWIELSSLREVGGKYRVLLANELEETQYTDELRLVAVDHPPGVKVAADLAGRMRAFARPLAPTKAVDEKGRDILNFVAANDRVFWVCPLEEKSPDDAELRSELLFEFPKPVGAKTARLLANVWTTAWGSRSAGMFLEHYGKSLQEKYEEVDARGPMYFKLANWMAAEELATLKVWVETPGGWKARSMIMGGAPFITKDKAYAFDVGDIPGGTLRIKLRPPVNFWMVNSLAVEYGDEPPVSVTEIAAERAVDHTGRDVGEILAETDGSYLENPDLGDRTELVFAAPPLAEGLERTVFVKASGYYKVHVDATGEPQTELAARILTEPGFAARYSFREYLKWEAGLRAQAGREGRR